MQRSEWQRYPPEILGGRALSNQPTWNIIRPFIGRTMLIGLRLYPKDGATFMLVVVIVVSVLVALGTIEILFRCDETKTWPSARWPATSTGDLTQRFFDVRSVISADIAQRNRHVRLVPNTLAILRIAHPIQRVLLTPSAQRNSRIDLDFGGVRVIRGPTAVAHLAHPRKTSVGNRNTPQTPLRGLS